MLLVTNKSKLRYDKMYLKIKNSSENIEEVIVCNKSEYKSIKGSAMNDGTFVWRFNTLTNFKIKLDDHHITVRLVCLVEYFRLRDRYGVYEVNKHGELS